MNREHVLVCVTGQKTCEKLILEGARFARAAGAQLSILHVASNGLNFLGNPEEGEALEYLYRISSEHGAAMTLIRADDVFKTILDHVEQLGATQLVMGSSRVPEAMVLADEVRRLKPDLKIHSVIG